MNIILLSGGSGKRLWPLSNGVRSKQFLKVFKGPNGKPESMLQRMYRMMHELESCDSITIATSKEQVLSTQIQLNDSVNISVEPSRKNTFPAIALASAYLHDIMCIDYEETIIVCPVDTFFGDDYLLKIKVMENQINNNEANLVLLGIKPTCPSEKYGYIVPCSDNDISFVLCFKEKPKKEMAKQFIKQGALWNGGVFAFKLKYILDAAKQSFGFSDYNTILANYKSIPDISFDCAVVENESNIQVIRYLGQWKDMGTWNTLTESISDETIGNVTSLDCNNTHVINELHIPLIALGVDNLAIAATSDGILVADKTKSAELKNLVPDKRPMYETRLWGDYHVLEHLSNSNGNNSLVKHLVINQNEHISYQRHFHRTEIWIIVDGRGEIIIDGNKKAVMCGDTITIMVGVKHAVKALDKLHIIEIQIGNDLSEEDIERFDIEWK